jgi:hypothetical protein
MKTILVMLLLTLGTLCVGQQSTIQPNGWGWNRISDSRRLGFVEGFDFRTALALEQGTYSQDATTKVTCRLDPTTIICALHQLEGDTLMDIPSDKTAEMMSAFYAQPQNLPVRWGHAVVIAEAMVSGLPIPETLLKTLRQEDAR